MRDMKVGCYNCKFAKPKDEEEHLNRMTEKFTMLSMLEYQNYECKRFPPQVVSGWGSDSDSPYAWKFPIVTGRTHCHEYKQHPDFDGLEKSTF